MTYTEVLAQARSCMGSYCKACPVCNGLACGNAIPGPGAKGVGDMAIRNYRAWQEIRVNMDTLCENKPVDTAFTLFGKTFRYPFFAGPAGAVHLHYGEKYDDQTYNRILVAACAESGIAAFTGDGTDPQVTAVCGGGAEGVQLYVEKLGSELIDTMKMCGAFSLEEITRDMIRVTGE